MASWSRCGAIVLLPRLAGALAAGWAAWRTGNLTLTIIGGFAALWAVEASLGLAG